MPSATAPLETSTTCLPCLTSALICCAQAAIAVLSRPWPLLVTRLEPTFTISVLLSCMSETLIKLILLQAAVALLLVRAAHVLVQYGP